MNYSKYFNTIEEHNVYFLRVPKNIMPPKVNDILTINGEKYKVKYLSTPEDIMKGRGGPVGKSMIENGIGWDVKLEKITRDNMKHIAKIQTEFLKKSRNWDDLSYDEQKNYLQRHPQSKRRLTAQPSTLHSDKLNNSEDNIIEISSEFSKYATWNDLSQEQQKIYLKNHPASKKKLSKPQILSLWNNITLQNYPRTTIKYVDNTVIDDASWDVDKLTGEITIFVTNSYLKSIKKHNAQWALNHTIAHEYTEAKIAINLARQKYPDISPYIAINSYPQLGGEAHKLAIKKLDNISEIEYMKKLKIESKYLK